MTSRNPRLYGLQAPTLSGTLLRIRYNFSNDSHVSHVAYCTQILVVGSMSMVSFRNAFVMPIVTSQDGCAPRNGYQWSIHWYMWGRFDVVLTCEDYSSASILFERKAKFWQHELQVVDPELDCKSLRCRYFPTWRAITTVENLSYMRS